MEKKIRVVVLEVGMLPREEHLDDHGIRLVLAGHMEPFVMPHGIKGLCNGDGKLMHFPYNFFYQRDWIAGNAVFVNTDKEDFCDLTDDQFAWLMDEFYEPDKRK